MIRILACLGLAIAVTGGLSAQPVSQAFDVASVKRNPAGYGPITRMKGSAGRIDYIDVPLKWLIRQAYRVQDSQISGPAWLDSEGYDISATFPAATSSRQQSEMWQSLLAERFKLAIHRESREVPAYWLVPGKSGAKLHAVDAAPGGFQIKQDGTLRHLKSQTSAAGLAVFLSDQLGMPVVDHTELKGTLDIALDWNISDQLHQDAPGRNLPLLRPAVESQLGLKLEPKKTLLEILIIDRAQKIPTEN